MAFSQWVHLDVLEIKAETEKSFLLHMKEGTLWVPKSQMCIPDMLEVGDKDITVSVTEWFASKNGIET